MMMWFKACPRCRGDMFMDSDYYGPVVSCIQCGHTLQQPLSATRPSRFVEEPPAVMPSADLSLSLNAVERKVRVA
jgi:hypothetical protein